MTTQTAAMNPPPNSQSPPDAGSMPMPDTSTGAAEAVDVLTLCQMEAAARDIGGVAHLLERQIGEMDADSENGEAVAAMRAQVAALASLADHLTRELGEARHGKPLSLKRAREICGQLKEAQRLVGLEREAIHEIRCEAQETKSVTAKSEMRTAESGESRARSGVGAMFKASEPRVIGSAVAASVTPPLVWEKHSPLMTSIIEAAGRAKDQAVSVAKAIKDDPVATLNHATSSLYRSTKSAVKAVLPAPVVSALRPAVNAVEHVHSAVVQKVADGIEGTANLHNAAVGKTTDAFERIWGVGYNAKIEEMLKGTPKKPSSSPLLESDIAKAPAPGMMQRALAAAKALADVIPSAHATEVAARSVSPATLGTIASPPVPRTPQVIDMMSDIIAP